MPAMNDFILPPIKKRRKVENGHSKPLILVACTPLKACAHEMIWQSGEMIFCDSKIIIVLCSFYQPVARGVPLAVAITSDEKQGPIKRVMEMVK